MSFFFKQSSPGVHYRGILFSYVVEMHNIKDICHHLLTLM